MKTSYLWILGALVLVFIIKKGQAATATPKASNPNKTGTAGTTTGTQTTPDPAWHGWDTSADTVLKNTTSTIKTATESTKSLYSGILGIFGGASTATGKASNPTTNGSGAGVPTNTDRNPVNETATYDDSIYNPSIIDTQSQTSDTEDPYAGIWG
jgi:hypothetical protein